MVYSIKRGKGNPHAIAHKIRRQRVYKRIPGAPERPRLMITRFNRHMVAQVVNNTIGHTLCAASALKKAVKGVEGHRVGATHKTGELIVGRAKALSIEVVVPDRDGSKCRDRIATIAEGVREGGLKL